MKENLKKNIKMEGNNTKTKKKTLERMENLTKT